MHDFIVCSVTVGGVVLYNTLVWLGMKWVTK